MFRKHLWLILALSVGRNLSSLGVRTSNPAEPQAVGSGGQIAQVG